MRLLLRSAILTVAIGALTLSSYGRGNPVPDEATAIRVAEKVLIPIYGKKQIESERPFTAKLVGNVWEVWGYLPPTMDGGVAEVRIDKRNGRILKISHGK